MGSLAFPQEKNEILMLIGGFWCILELKCLYIFLYFSQKLHYIFAKVKEKNLIYWKTFILKEFSRGYKMPLNGSVIGR
jgi:hypothetical protein